MLQAAHVAEGEFVCFVHSREGVFQSAIVASVPVSLKSLSSVMIESRVGRGRAESIFLSLQ